MTSKRFTVPKNYQCIQDNLTKEHYLCEDKTEAINLAYLLNELSDENEQLKQTIKKMGELGGFNKHMIKTICGDVE